MSGTLSPLFTWRSAIASRESELPPTQRHAALTLSLHMSEKGDSCFPGMPLLVEETGLGLSTVREALRQLAAAGWLERTVSHGRGQSNRYRALIPDTYRQQAAVSQENRQMTDGKPPAPGHEDVKESGSLSNESASAVTKQAVEALYDAFQHEGMRAPSTKSQRASYMKQVRECVAAGWTPETVGGLAAAYRRHETLGRTMLTIFALCKWAGELEAVGVDQAARLRRRMEERGIT